MAYTYTYIYIYISRKLKLVGLVSGVRIESVKQLSLSLSLYLNIRFYFLAHIIITSNGLNKLDSF